MKRIVSVSLGSSKRDHVAEAEFLGEKFILERRGVDGDFRKAIALVSELDGQVDAFGMGGTDVWLNAGSRRFMIQSSLPIYRAARKSPMVDGSGVKNILQRNAVRYLRDELKYPLQGKTAFIVCAVDGYGLASEFDKSGCKLVMGDLIYTIGIPIKLTTVAGLDRVARALAPIVTRLPYSMLYPTGSKQEKRDPKKDKYAYLYNEADIISGDWHYIAKYMPDQLPGKIMITNTITKDDRVLLKDAGLKLLVTTTPEFSGGRSFATNVIEGVLITLLGKKPEDVKPGDYEQMIDRLGLKPKADALN
ncbi:MAG: quinate 5-dehydrogenase [Chloroflexota bacterium]